MARESWRPWLVALALLMLATGLEAQRGKGRARGGKRGARGAATAPAVPGAAKEPPLPPLTIPGEEMPGAGAQPKKGAPPPKDAGAATKAREAPLDPMKAADLVTAAADHQAEQLEREARQLREHFQVCDLDENGWLSLRETQVTLSLGRDEFRRADSNQDGRLELGEFEAQRSLLLVRLGVPAASPPDARPAPQPEPPSDPALTPPAREPESGALPPVPGSKNGRRPRSEFASLLVKPSDLLQRYDLDHSKGISVAELEKLLTELGLVLSPELVVAQMDPNHSGELGARELTPLAWLASKHVPEALLPERTAPQAQAAPGASATEVEPPTAVAARVPTHFDLLDPGRDGFIDEADLRALQSQARLDVRLRPVLSAMDEDGDGRLSELEFQRSMGRR